MATGDVEMVTEGRVTGDVRGVGGGGPEFGLGRDGLDGGDEGKDGVGGADLLVREAGSGWVFIPEGFEEVFGKRDLGGVEGHGGRCVVEGGTLLTGLTGLTVGGQAAATWVEKRGWRVRLTRSAMTAVRVVRWRWATASRSLRRVRSSSVMSLVRRVTSRLGVLGMARGIEG